MSSSATVATATSYFGGSPTHMGRVYALPYNSFQELVTLGVESVPIRYTRAEFHALPPKEQARVKAVDYLVAARFKDVDSPRQGPLATTCNVLFVDVDDSVEAQRMITAGFGTLLGDLGAVVWHTARSTPDAPRLRVMVRTDDIPAALYGSAVESLAALLGMESVTHESKVPVQAMYLPIQFQDEPPQPLLHEKPDGCIFQPVGLPNLPDKPDPGDLSMGDITFLRAPLDNLTDTDLRDALGHISPDCIHQQWVETGMALKHQLGDDAGLEVWDEWSSRGEKYAGRQETEAKWKSFSANPGTRHPITARSVLKRAVEGGWQNRPLTVRLFKGVHDWLSSEARSSEELLDQGAQRIAKLSGVIDDMQQDILVRNLASAMKAKGLTGIAPSAVAKQVRRLRQQATKSSEPPLWMRDLYFLEQSHRFYRRGPSVKLLTQTVDLVYSSPDPETPTSKYLVREAGIPVCINAFYAPQKAPLVTFEHSQGKGSTEKGWFVNTYRPSYAKSDASMAAVCGAAAIQHFTHLLGQRYFTTLADFVGFMTKHPGRKIRWAPLIQSPYGAGKGILAEMMMAILGVSNVQRLAAQQVLDKSHNGWVNASILVVMDEIRIVGTNRFGVLEGMKTLITDDYVSVRQLYEPVQTVPNVTNYIFFTNHHDAIPLDRGDRRFWVIESPLQTKEHILALGPTYYPTLANLIRDHPGGFRSFFENWTISPDFDPDGRAPSSEFLSRMADLTASPVHHAVVELLHDQPHSLLQSDLVSISVIRDFLDQRRGLSHPSDQQIASVLRQLDFQPAGRHLLSGQFHTLWTKGPVDHAAGDAGERLLVL